MLRIRSVLNMNISYWAVLLIGSVAGLQLPPAGIYPGEKFQCLFDKFKAMYNKTYKNEKEENMRYKIFVDKLREINRKNAKSFKIVQFGINEFTDISDKEFNLQSSGCANVKEETDSLEEMPLSMLMSSNVGRLAAPALRDSSMFDWRSTGVVTKVSHQLRCGSCWAWSLVATDASPIDLAAIISDRSKDGPEKAIASRSVTKSETDYSQIDKRLQLTGCIESLYAIRYNLNPPRRFSVQQLVDCTKSTSCDEGGTFQLGMKYIKKESDGLNDEKDYPYVGRQGACKPKLKKSVVTVTGRYKLPPSEEAILAALRNHGPVPIAMNVNGLDSYLSGIWQGDTCYDELQHAVLVVGYGTENDIPYWIIKNSWGESFGEKGYFRILRGKGVCSIGSHAVMPKIAGIFKN